jgi:large subunit ribosomal protein L23
MANKEKADIKPEYIYQYSWVIRKPKVTEKSTKLAESNVYTFEVHKKANKKEIEEAVKNIYGVKPLMIRVLNNKSVKTVKKNIKGRTRSMRKAYVYLRIGDSITLL